RAVYLSLSPETALAESLSHSRRFGLAIRDAMPKTLNAVVAEFSHILDLTSATVRSRLRLSLRRMLEERWWDLEANDREAVTQAVGRAAYEIGFEGLLVPSAADPGSLGLVYFPDRLFDSTRLQIINRDQQRGPT